MAERREFYYPSSDGKTRIHAVEWTPEGEARGVVQLVHGIAEYALRYDTFARQLTARGFVVAAEDHMGHGGSVAEGAARLCFGETDGWQHAVDDVHTLRSLMGEKYPALPYALLGHSMGSFLARHYLIAYPGTVRAAIIMGTGQPGALTLAGGQFLAKRTVKQHGAAYFDPQLSAIAFGAYNKPFSPNRTEYDWLSVNTANVDAYLADPLCGGEITAGLLRDMLGGLAFIGKEENAKKMDPNVPVLFVSGEKDPVGDMGAGVRRVRSLFERVGVRDITCRLYPDLRHEILNEESGADVGNDIIAWLEGKL